jgi:hypothetical protein
MPQAPPNLGDWLLVSSSWVYAIRFRPEEGLGVWFRERHGPGFKCYYPNTDVNLYQLMLGSGSMGRFVHRFLWGRRYVRIP